MKRPNRIIFFKSNAGSAESYIQIRILEKEGEAGMNQKEFALRCGEIYTKLYRTALGWLGNETLAADALGEAVYKGLRFCGKLRDEELFDAWMMRILVNECHNEKRRGKNCVSLDEIPETAGEQFDSLPLREALARLPKELRDVVTLRFFAGYTLRETAEILGIPQGTASTRQRRALALLKLELGEEENE